MANTIPLPESMTPRSAFVHGVKSWITLHGEEVPTDFVLAQMEQHWLAGFRAAAEVNEKSGQRPTWGTDIGDIADQYGYSKDV